MRFTATRVEFLKNNNPTRSKVHQQFAQCINRIWVIHQNESTNNCIKAVVESSQSWVTLDELHVRDPLAFGARLGANNCGSRPVNAHDSPRWTNKFARKQCHITTSTTHIKHAHPRKQTGFPEQLSRKWLVHSGL